MQNKSKIQLIQEKIARKHNFLDGLYHLMEKYTIEDSVFMYNGGVKEVCKGYFEVIAENDSLQTSINEMADVNEAIRIINNEKFQLGIVHQFLNECTEGSQIFDIESIEEL